jgi:hypothetical protein
MEKLIENARSQFNQFGEVRMTIYLNKSVNDCYDIVEHSLDKAIDIISYYYQSIMDDISVSHANAI